MPPWNDSSDAVKMDPAVPGLQHSPPQNLAEHERAGQIDLEHLVEPLERMFGGRSTANGSGVIDQDVHLTVARGQRFGELGHLGAIGEVDAIPGEVAAQPAYAVPDRRRRRIESRRYRDDVGTGDRQRLGDREPDPALRARHHGEAPGQIERIHQAFSSTSSFIARPASRTSKADWISASGTVLVTSLSVGIVPSATSSAARSKSRRW
jgi:hypothetical protein